jgi:hypothetical protein
MNNVINIIWDGILNFIMIEGFISLCYLFLVLLQLILCKDATMLIGSKLLHRPLSLRLRLLKRSLHDPYYLASVGIFIAVCLLIGRLGYEFIYNIHNPALAVFFHGIFWPCLGWLYYQRGYRAIFFVEMGKFLKGKID